MDNYDRVLAVAVALLDDLDRRLEPHERLAVVVYTILELTRREMPTPSRN